MKETRPAIPEFATHKPKTMVWTELTPLREHKELEAAGVQPKVIPDGTKKNPLPLSRATTELRRAYPYLFDCAAYVKTHAPNQISSDLFYSRFTMPYSVFLDYCLDTCNEQMQYLKEEIYKLGNQPAKYIKTSKRTITYGHPVIVTLKHTELETGKEKRITNIGQDAKVDLVHVQILNELLDVSHGHINVPKAFYAKVKRAFNNAKELAKELTEKSYRENVNAVKDYVAMTGEKISTSDAVKIINALQEQKSQIKNMEQGGYYPIYLALEYILANKSKGAKQQDYRFIDLCEKCAPELVRYVDGKRYFNRTSQVAAFLGNLQMLVMDLSTEPAFGITGIEPNKKRTDGDYITVFFTEV